MQEKKAFIKLIITICILLHNISAYAQSACGNVTSIATLECERSILKGSIDILRKKNVEVQKVRSEIIVKKDGYVQEVYGVIDRYPTFKSSQVNESLQRKLQLIQYDDAYIQKLDEIEKSILIAITRTEFLTERIDTDLKVARVVGKDTIDKLRSEIKEGMKESIPLSDSLDLSNLTIIPVLTLEEIWLKLRDQKKKNVRVEQAAEKEREKKEESRLMQLQAASVAQEKRLAELRDQVGQTEGFIAKQKAYFDELKAQEVRLEQAKKDNEQKAKDSQQNTQSSFHKNEHGHDVFTIVGRSLTAAQEVVCMEEGGYDVNVFTQKTMMNGGVNSYDNIHRLESGRRYTIVLISGREVAGNRTSKNIQKYAASFGYEIPPAGIMPRIREVISKKYFEDPDIFSIVGLHEPLSYPDGEIHFLIVYDGPFGGQYLGASTVDRGKKWGDSDVFAFIDPKN